MKPNLGDVLADKYRLDRVLGEGGMSTVFGAVNELTGKQVAIKWLQPDMIRDDEQSQRLLREAQATSSIDHPNVVNVFDVGRHEGALFLVMELLHGEPLSELLARGPQDATEFVRLMMPVLRGVQAAHRMGVVHRDLKPDNIFLCRDPHGEAREPKILDFGISKLVGIELDGELTREGTIFGTPQYMAPEQMRDARVADARSDVYALGIIFYRALCDEYPYDADTLTALAIRIVEGNAPPLHERATHIDAGLSDVVMRALSLDPAQRFQSVAAFAQALEPYADGLAFSSGVERDSAARIARRDSSASVRDSQLRAVPTTLRESTHRQLGEGVTTALDASDLLPVSAPPRAESVGLAIPPPPRRKPPAPPRGRSAAARGTSRAGRRLSLSLGGALFALALIAPVGWQLWHKARGAQDISSASPPAEPPRARPAAAEPAPAHPVVPTEAPISEPPSTLAESSESIALPHTPDESHERGMLEADPTLRGELGKPKRRSLPRAGGTPASRAQAAALEPPALSHVPERDPEAMPAWPIETERNPYVRN